MTYWKGYYSLGLCEYELWVDEDDLRDDTMHVLFVGTDREQKAKRYKIQFTPNGKRQFVRPNRRRIYLDDCIRCNYPD